MTETVGIIGTGKFGMALCNILAENGDVLLYARRNAIAEEIRQTGTYKNVALHQRVQVTEEIQEIPQRCTLIFVVVPAAYFGESIRSMADYLKPWHMIIHGTKGVEVDPLALEEGGNIMGLQELYTDQIWTMSELIRQETSVARIGCLAGPNLAPEILKGYPAAAVVASPFDEVIQEGSLALKSSRFRVHGSHDLRGIELAGILKNVIAIASGMVEGLGWGHNTRAFLLTHGLAEMITIGNIFGVNARSFLGLAGMGDLIGTASSIDSRNYRVGKLLAEGKSLDSIQQSMEDTAEGLRTVPLIKIVAQTYGVSLPITQNLFKVIFEGKSIQDSIQLLMELPLSEDVAFI